MAQAATNGCLPIDDCYQAQSKKAAPIKSLDDAIRRPTLITSTKRVSHVRNLLKSNSTCAGGFRECLIGTQRKIRFEGGRQKGVNRAAAIKRFGSVAENSQVYCFCISSIVKRVAQSKIGSNKRPLKANNVQQITTSINKHALIKQKQSSS